MYYINSIDNNKIAVYDLNPHCQKVVFMVHGWPLSHKIFEYQVNVLVDKGYRVIAIDLRGFGNSDVTASGYDYNSLASDVYSVIATLGLYDFTLVGFSMGGAIVTRYMTLFNGFGVSKLCLIDAAVPSFTKTPNNPYGSSIGSVNKLLAGAYTNRPQVNADFGKMLFASNPTQSLRNWFQEISNSASGVGTIKTLISLRDEDLYCELPNIQVLTGIFHGKLDKICPYNFALIQKKLIPNSKLFTYPKSGHASFYDELEKFNSDFLGFLSI